MIEESYVSFETAKLLKEAGFEANLRTKYVEEEGEWVLWDYGLKRSDYNYFDDTIACPTQALAARWLREVNNLHVYAIQTNLPLTKPQTDKWEWGYIIAKIDDPNGESVSDMNFPNYEAAKEYIRNYYLCNGEYPCEGRDYCEFCNGHNSSFDCNEGCGADDFNEGFIAGAQCRIKSVWHDKKDPPKIGEEILMESVLLSGKTMYKVRVMTDYKEWQENNFIKSWAYIDDLLTNGKKATE